MYLCGNSALSFIIEVLCHDTVLLYLQNRTFAISTSCLTSCFPPSVFIVVYTCIQVSFLDYMAYIPLFVQMHETIVDNPFDTLGDAFDFVSGGSAEVSTTLHHDNRIGTEAKSHLYHAQHQRQQSSGSDSVFGDSATTRADLAPSPAARFNIPSPTTRMRMLKHAQQQKEELQQAKLVREQPSTSNTNTTDSHVTNDEILNCNDENTSTSQRTLEVSTSFPDFSSKDTAGSVAESIMPQILSTLGESHEADIPAEAVTIGTPEQIVVEKPAGAMESSVADEEDGTVSRPDKPTDDGSVVTDMERTARQEESRTSMSQSHREQHATCAVDISDIHVECEEAAATVEIATPAESTEDQQQNTTGESPVATQQKNEQMDKEACTRRRSELASTSSTGFESSIRTDAMSQAPTSNPGTDFTATSQVSLNERAGGTDTGSKAGKMNRWRRSGRASQYVRRRRKWSDEDNSSMERQAMTTDTAAAEKVENNSDTGHAMPSHSLPDEDRNVTGNNVATDAACALTVLAAGAAPLAPSSDAGPLQSQILSLGMDILPLTTSLQVVHPPDQVLSEKEQLQVDMFLTNIAMPPTCETLSSSAQSGPRVSRPRYSVVRKRKGKPQTRHDTDLESDGSPVARKQLKARSKKSVARRKPARSDSDGSEPPRRVKPQPPLRVYKQAHVTDSEPDNRAEGEEHRQNPRHKRRSRKPKSKQQSGSSEEERPGAKVMPTGNDPRTLQCRRQAASGTGRREPQSSESEQEAELSNPLSKSHPERPRKEKASRAKEKGASVSENRRRGSSENGSDEGNLDVATRGKSKPRQHHRTINKTRRKATEKSSPDDSDVGSQPNHRQARSHSKATQQQKELQQQQKHPQSEEAKRGQQEQTQGRDEENRNSNSPDPRERGLVRNRHRRKGQRRQRREEYDSSEG